MLRACPPYNGYPIAGCAPGDHLHLALSVPSLSLALRFLCPTQVESTLGHHQGWKVVRTTSSVFGMRCPLIGYSEIAFI